MMKFNTNALREIPIRDVVGMTGERLQRRGSATMALCPNHDDHHRSLLVGGRINCVKCMACGWAADTIGFLMRHDNIDFAEACTQLHNHFGIPFADDNHSHGRSTTPHTDATHGRSTTQALLEGTRRKTRRHLEQLQPLKVEHPIFLTPEIHLEPFISGLDSLSQCLVRRFPVDDVIRVVRHYGIGAWPNTDGSTATMFPSIDRHGNLRDIKVQTYCTDPASPRWAHSSRRMFWLGPLLQPTDDQSPAVNAFQRAMGTLPGGDFDRRCLFGEHLLSLRPNAPVLLVESPKNAVTAACAYPHLVVVAAGNKSMLASPDILLPLHNRQVAVLPDLDAQDDWMRTLDARRHIAHFTLSPLVDDLRTLDNPKADIADLLLAPG